MSLDPAKLALAKKKLYIPATSFCGGATGTGAPPLTEVGTTGFVGSLMDTAGDDIRHFIVMPDWDITKDIYVWAIWASEAAAVGNRTITWKFLYAVVDISGGIPLGDPATALDTALVAQAPTGTTLTIERSATAGVINGGTIVSATDYFMFLVEMDAFHADFVEAKTLMGVEFQYTPKWGIGKPQLEAKDWVP